MSIAEESVETASEPGSISRMPVIAYALAAGTFSMGTAEFLVAGLLATIATDIGASVGQTGLLITVFALGMIIGAPTMTIAMLRLSRRAALISALVVFAVGNVVVALGTDFFVLVAARFVTALATGAFWSMATVVAAQAVDVHSRSRAVGVVMSGGMLATVAGVPLGAVAGQYIGWRGPFFVLAAFALVTAASFVRLDLGRAGQRTASLRAEFGVLRSGRMGLALVACALITGSVLAAYSYATPLLTERAGLPEQMVPLILAGFGVCALVGTVIGGRLGDSRPYAASLLSAAGTAGVVILLCLVPSRSAAAVTLFLALGLLGFIANPIAMTLVVRFAGTAPTLVTALSVSSFNVGTTIATWLASGASESSWGVMGPFFVAAGAAVVLVVPLGALAVLSRRDQADFMPARLSGTGPQAGTSQSR
jgi:DHA1 family chloramphenicol resistance protein-like MFS transporter